MRMDAYSFGVLVLWLLNFSGDEESHHLMENAIRSASGEGLTVAKNTTSTLTQATIPSLIDFYSRTLINSPDGRSSYFWHLRSLLRASELVNLSGEESSDLALGHKAAP